MKVKSKKFFSKPSSDLRKGVSLQESLNKKSEDTHRESFRPVRIESDKPVTKVKLNISGNRRGMNNVENPPSSEEMQLKRAMRKLWNKKMPVLACSNCQLSAQCPQFKAGYVCAFEPFLQSHEIKTEEDLIEYSKQLLQEGVKRAQLTLIFEKLSGAKPSLETSESLAYLFNQLMQLHERMTKANSVSIEMETSDGSIIGRLFGNLDSLVGATEDAKAKPIDVPMFAEETKQLADKSSQEDVLDHITDMQLAQELSMMRSDASKPKETPIMEEIE